MLIFLILSLCWYRSVGDVFHSLIYVFFLVLIYILITFVNVIQIFFSFYLNFLQITWMNKEMNSIHKWVNYVVIPKFYHVFNFSHQFVFLNFIHILSNQEVVEVSAQFLNVTVAVHDHHLSSMLWKTNWRILATRGS